MKEKIYTIPVNEAFSTDCECPLCLLRKKLEDDAVDYTLGAAMMEPDYRILTNESGFCSKHYSMLFQKPNKLSLALVLDTHLEEVRKNLAETKKDVDAFASSKKSLFKKNDNKTPQKLFDFLNKTECSCVICNKINQTVERYVDVIFYLWDEDDEFKKKIENGKGFCLPDFNLLCQSSIKYLNQAKASEFIKMIYDKEMQALDAMQTDIHKFTLKFDYRNKDMPLGTAIDAPFRTIEKISGFMSSEDNEQ